jgi:hypothetical protein
MDNFRNLRGYLVMQVADFQRCVRLVAKLNICFFVFLREGNRVYAIFGGKLFG